MDEVQVLRAEIDQLRSEQDGRRSTRRNMLRLTGAAVAGGAVAAIANGGSASAIVANPVLMGVNNDSSISGTGLTSNNPNGTLKVANTTTSGYGVQGAATGGGIGVLGTLDTPDMFGYGVQGNVAGTVGFPLVGQGGAAQLLLKPYNSGVPTSGHHQSGEFVATANALYYCVAGNMADAGTWRTIADYSAAGSFFPISPARVYDSRKANPGPQAALATGNSRTISVADQYDPATAALVQPNVVPSGATAISYNLTVVNTVGAGGYLAVNEGGNTVVAASAINWTGAGLSLANASVVQLNGTRQITVICGGAATSTNFIVDVVGYYR